MLPERDYLLLTEYIDGEMTGEEREAFEKRLREEPELHAEYQDLQATVQLLRMAEPVRVPRNFTLDPAVYGRQPQPSFFDRLAALFGPVPVSATAGAMVALLVFFGAFTLLGNRPTDMAMDNTAMVESAEADDETIVETVIIEDEAAFEESMPESAAADMAEESAEDDMADLPAGGAGGGSEAAPSDDDEVTIEEAEATAAAQTVPMEDDAERLPEEDATILAEEEEQTPQRSEIPVTLIVVAFVSLGLGGLTFAIIRRQLR